MAFEKVGVQAVVEGLGQYKSAAGQIEATNKRLGQGAVAAGESAGKFGQALKAIGTIATGVIAARGLMMIPQIMGDLMGTARDLELQMKKANVVFGEQIGVVQDWAEANAHAMGLTKREAVAAGAAFADLLIPMGFTRKAATEMTTNVLGLSGALAEWSGGTRSAAEVSRILAKAMLGEREQLKELGISITEAEVQGRLLEKGQKDLTGTMLQQAKAVATQELLFEKSQDAQAAYAEGSGTAARKQAELTAQFKEAKEEIALALAPAIGELLSLATKLVPVVEAGTRAFKRSVEIGKSVVTQLKNYKEAVIALTIALIAMQLKPIIANMAVMATTAVRVARDFVMLTRTFGTTQVAMMALRSAFLGPWGLVAAVGVTAVALIGLNRLLGTSRDRAKELREALAGVGEEAARRGLDPQIEQVKFLQRELERLVDEYEKWFFELRKGTQPSMVAQAVLDDIREAMIGLREEASDLTPEYTDLNTAIENGELSMKAILYLFPDFEEGLRESAEGAEDLGEGAGEAASQVDELTEALNKGTSALKDQEAAIRKVTGQQTQEEARLHAVSAALDADIKAREAWIAAGGRLSAEQETETENWRGQKEAVDAQIESIVASKEAQGAYLSAMLQGRPTVQGMTEDVQGLGLVIVEHTEQLYAAKRAQELVQGATDLLRRLGLEPLASTLERTVEPHLAETIGRLSGVEREAGEAEGAVVDLQTVSSRGLSLDTSSAQQSLRNLIALAREYYQMMQSIIGFWLGGGAPPSFQYGGIVPGPVGKPQMAIVHGGERIVPAALSVIMPSIMPTLRGQPGASQFFNYGQVQNVFPNVRDFRNVMAEIDRGLR